jgi:hypothetical protein
VSQKGFWRLRLDLTCAEDAPRMTTSPYVCPTYNNVKQSTRAITEGRCSVNRTDHGLKDMYPHLHLRDNCYDFAACTPKGSCTGNNTCAPEYRWTLDQCKKWERGTKLRGLSLANGKVDYGLGEGQYSCDTDEDCRTRSGNTNTPNGADNANQRPMDGAFCATIRGANGTTLKRCQCKPSERCSMCTVYTHLRKDGECVPCPECPECLIAGLVVAAVLGCVGLKWLSAKKFNLAFINIIVDYFQVLSLFSRIRIKWPPFIKTLMELLSFFSFNIDVASPECLVPEIEYEYKYYAMMGLPIVCINFIIIAWFYEVVRKMCCLRYRKWRRINSHGSMIVGLTLLLMYFFYLELIRRTLDVFNCKETDPSDGNYYTGFTSIGCEGGYCICWESGGVHARIAIVNIAPILVYVIGFPTFVYCKIKRNRTLIMEDQLLRAHDLGNVEAENKFAFFIRQRYSRMYYQFKPEKVGWIVVILWRKFMIVLIGGLLRHNPSFQLAIMMLVLFTCYILHVKNRPYMSSVERLLVIEEHKAKALAGDPVAIQIQKHIKKATDDRAAKNRRSGLINTSSLGSALSHANRTFSLYSFVFISLIIILYFVSLFCHSPD